MSDLLTEFRDHLAGVTGLTVGSNLFAGHMPDQSGLACGLFVTGGRTAPDNTAWRYTNIQVKVLAPPDDYDAGRILVFTIYAWYWGATNFTLPNYHVYYTRPIQPPYQLGLDERGRMEWVFNLEVMNRDKV